MLHFPYILKKAVFSLLCSVWLQLLGIAVTKADLSRKISADGRSVCGKVFTHCPVPREYKFKAISSTY